MRAAVAVVVAPSGGQVAVPLLDSMPPIRQSVGRPRFRPDMFQGDRGYGCENNIQTTLQRGIVPLLAKLRDDTHGSELGREPAEWGRAPCGGSTIIADCDCVTSEATRVFRRFTHSLQH